MTHLRFDLRKLARSMRHRFAGLGRGWLVGGAAMSLVLAVGTVYLVTGCQSTPQSAPPTVDGTLSLEGITGEPTVRVRIVTASGMAELASAAPLVVGPGPGLTQGQHDRSMATPVRVRREGDAFVIEPSGGQAIRWRLPTLHVRPAAGQTVTVNGKTYPGAMSIHPRPDVAAVAGRGAAVPVDVVNHVPMEQYLPGVISRELYPNWHEETFRAQAIAARTYAIVQRMSRSKRHFDLESTEASQVYGGTTANTRAIEAVASTRGIVLTWQGRIFPAYYSSCSGGLGQDAAVAFPNGQNIPPLRAREHGGWGAKASTYTWGPIARDRATFSRRLAAWGRARGDAIAAVGPIRSVTATAANSVGRPTQFTVTDDAGKSYLINCESLRHAANYSAVGLPDLKSSAKLKSSFIAVNVAGNRVSITGRGHGHGVGMCQWGAQGIALGGYNAASILAFYYPGTRLQRAY